MKKIIAAFDGLKYSESTRDHAIALAKITGAHLVGIFLDDRSYTGYKIYDLIGDDGINQVKLKELTKKDKLDREEACRDFESACREAGIEYSVHHDRALALHELKHESIYADLLVIGMHETLTHHSEKLPTLFIRRLLSDVHCPVLLVPSRFMPIKKLIILYDGAPSSVHATKMCSYVLPELKNLEAEVVSVRPVKAGQHLPDNRLMKEYMKRHFPSAKYHVINGNADEEIRNFLKTKPANSLVLLGAYNRGAASRWFRESMADRLMKELKLPLLVAHGN
jgi:nucleotide-binding universal stress UspA family protein